MTASLVGRRASRNRRSERPALNQRHSCGSFRLRIEDDRQLCFAGRFSGDGKA